MPGTCPLYKFCYPPAKPPAAHCHSEGEARRIFFSPKGTYMRLDKYLKVSRLIKRRTIANEACDAGRVTINEKPAKAGAEVKPGDVIEIAFGNRTVKVRVKDVKEVVRKEEAEELFEYISDGDAPR